MKSCLVSRSSGRLARKLQKCQSKTVEDGRDQAGGHGAAGHGRAWQGRGIAWKGKDEESSRQAGRQAGNAPKAKSMKADHSIAWHGMAWAWHGMAWKIGQTGTGKGERKRRTYPLRVCRSVRRCDLDMLAAFSSFSKLILILLQICSDLVLMNSTD